MRCALDLDGRVALVTGVSRQRGIGIAIARQLGQLGAKLFLHGFTPCDRAQPWGAEAEGAEVLANQLQQDGITVAHMEANFLDADAPKKVMNAAVATYRHRLGEPRPNSEGASYVALWQMGRAR